MNTEPTRVLIIEDDMACADVVRTLLTREPGPEFTTYHVASLRDAEAFLNSNTVDVILIDLNLPDSKGILTVKGLLTGGVRAPAVVFSGLESQKLISEALRAGAQDYVVKGGDIHAVTHAIRHAVERARAETWHLQAERDLLAAQRRQFESNRIAELGRVADGIAQELRNPLAVLRLGMEVLGRLGVASNPSVARTLEMMNQVLQQATNILERRCACTSPGTGDLLPVHREDAAPSLQMV